LEGTVLRAAMKEEATMKAGSAGNNNFDISNVSKALNANHDRLEKEAKSDDVIGGIKVFGFGIPNSFAFGMLRSDSQKSALNEPAKYERAMQKLLESLREALASNPFTPSR